MPATLSKAQIAATSLTVAGGLATVRGLVHAARAGKGWRNGVRSGAVRRRVALWRRASPLYSVF